MPSELEETRTRFADSLVGCWSSASGSFSIVMDDSLQVNPDGTAIFRGYGCFGYAEGETHLEWRQSHPFEIELRVIREVILQRDEELDDDEDEDEGAPKQEDGSPRWLTFRYDFVEVTHDLGTEVGLVAVGSDSKPHRGFYGSLAPMSYNGPIRTEQELQALRELQQKYATRSSDQRSEPEIGLSYLFSLAIPFVVIALWCCIFVGEVPAKPFDIKGFFCAALMLLLFWNVTLLVNNAPVGERIYLNRARMATGASLVLHLFFYALASSVDK